MAGKRLLSYPYMILRASTAGATLGTGILQTFVFARVLGPERFSLFIFLRHSAIRSLSPTPEW